jgi:hypothetical protein
MTVYDLAQAQIVLGGVCTIYLLSGKSRYWRFGFVVGLLNQWAWFYSAYHDAAWGLALINVAYCLGYLRGIRNYFWEKNDDRHSAQADGGRDVRRVPHAVSRSSEGDGQARTCSCRR